MKYRKQIKLGKKLKLNKTALSPKTYNIRLFAEFRFFKQKKGTTFYPENKIIFHSTFIADYLWKTQTQIAGCRLA